MTRQEAIQAMKEGRNIRHRFFSPNEFIYMNEEGRIVLTEGYTVDSREFWYYRGGVHWEDGWEIVKLVKTKNWGKDKINLSHLGSNVVKGTPIEIHIKTDGTIDNEASVAFIMATPFYSRHFIIYGEMSMRTLTEALSDLGYELRKKEEKYCEICNRVIPDDVPHCNISDCPKKEE